MREIYSLGVRNYISSYYNILDSISMCLYLASYALRLVAQYKIEAAGALYWCVTHAVLTA